MSDQNRLVAATRTEFGKGAARRARRAGNVPAVLYGHGSEPRHLNLPSLEFAAILRAHGTNALVELEIDGKEQLALTKSVVIHPIRNYIEHADLLVVKKGEKVTVDVPVVVSGDAAAGSLVTQEADTVALEADALNIPEELSVSIENAPVGTRITAADLTLPAGAALQADPELLVVNIVAAPTARQMEEDIPEEQLPTEDESSEG
ncbi:50S ribosomal protein L25/general stress protein Ctc [Rhodococcus sp. HNM0569]|uniref:50S ribosomal protein L25/general stress protein Ctc n=1 Tax=Rhodococcus sp. HNM0569 TaxID=2716340 RepID=UPI00146C124D|nr:50S ribosomal protein L25/general stress protein Ctc [Rhodococcus sp. HNM0569]NLU82705.1 50S ribosomal protein L25/general stress protein Ctc [Rhodococcus sp. HNM0569]